MGQSKNLGKRLNQHFTNGEVKNIIFVKDCYAGDCFYYKFYLCQTKDELDSLEKEKIEEYNAFGKGYNWWKLISLKLKVSIIELD